MQVQHLLKSAAVCLSKAGVESSSLEAELLLLACLGISRSALFLMGEEQIDAATCKQYQEFTSRRCKREPLQYIIGCCEFWSLDFYVTPAVLIPRPETEFLLEHAFTVVAGNEQKIPSLCLDLCTGSGVISVVLAKEYPKARIHASDYSVEALEVARRNIDSHNLAERITLICTDLFTGFDDKTQWDLIVTNPPYVKSTDIADLEPEVRDWEPDLALSGGVSGLAIIQQICHQAYRHLQKGGWLFMEIGADIAIPVFNLFQNSGRYERIKIVPDLAGRPRVLQARCKI